MQRKVRYLAGWGIDFENPEMLGIILKTHGIDEESIHYFCQHQSAVELHIEQNKIKKAYECYYLYADQFCKDLLDAENIDLPIDDWPNHKVFLLEKDAFGNHRIGGDIPKELVLPINKRMKTPFQYLGTLDGQDEYFNWLGINDFHIIFPLYECNWGVYLDYSDPNKPVIANTGNNEAWHSDDWYEDSLEDIGQILFKETPYKATDALHMFEDEDKDENCILGGVPLWIQSPEIPLCPQTNEPMQFVCVIKSNRTIKVINNASQKKLPFSNEFLCFGDMGYLYVFYHPQSKLAHLNWQW